MSTDTRHTDVKPTKGQLGGECARTVCHNPAEGYFHPALGWFYCGDCAKRVNVYAGQCVIRPLSDDQEVRS